MTPSHPLLDTFCQMLREQLPNLFRLYLNPYVAQTCFCLGQYVQSTWPRSGDHPYQSFLANSFDEALGGSIKLARYCASVDERPATGLVIDPVGRLGPFAGAPATGGAWVEFLPGLVVVRRPEELHAAVTSPERFGFVALVPSAEDHLDEFAGHLRKLARRDTPLVITCVERASLAELRRTGAGILQEMAPDIVVFDESFVNRDVPFAAFTARRALYDHWNRPGKTTFHSTTYQPNTISSLHFLRCLASGDPEFHREVVPFLERLHSDLGLRAQWFRRSYSPSLGKAIRSTGFETADIRAAGEFVHAAGRKVFDCVGGVACSIRGHNPATYVEEMKELEGVDCRAEVAARLRNLTGLECVLPAVSGATAVENALKIALVTQYPKRYVLALKSGFGGKSLFALTGTWGAAYKERIDPLYRAVLYVDPFAPDATAQIDKALASHDVAVVQVELIQGVGGVRRVPEQVIRYLHERRQQAGYLLLVDEIQTGMYRTGPFTQSGAMGLSPDLLVLGKGASDMMFPFALLAYSEALRERLDRAGSDLPAAIEKRYGYEYGYRTVLNVLRRADELRLSERTAESGALFTRLLREGLAGCKAVREVRGYGLLIGIELETTRWPRRWFRKRLFQFYLLAMLRHRRYPVLVGFCQYEPHVLKITPPLTLKPEAVHAVCATIIEVLKRPIFRLLATVLGGLIRSIGTWRRKHEHANFPAHEPGKR